ncbi:MAG: hypothetical protein A2063_09615 [Gallionellales bacterium GWA2_60_142]|nr:MAG: hypothetical protein A2063_09615 [Gallionellales bacterium GWA2_60_142]
MRFQHCYVGLNHLGQIDLRCQSHCFPPSVDPQACLLSELTGLVSMGLVSMGSESMGSESMGSESMGSESMGSESMGSESMGSE